ncbi:MAG: CvpA family protein [Bacteroidales bacterium]|nr:CvpA family protein [Bacteroidales bacterium]
MNTLDIVLLVLFVPAIIRGLSKGFLEQAIGMIAIVASVWAAFKFSKVAVLWVAPYLNMNETLLNVLVFASLLILVSLALVLIGKLITKIIELAMLGWLDKLLGLVFSILLTGLVLGIVIILIDTLNVKFGFINSEILDASVIYGLLRNYAYALFPFLKQLLLKQ